MAQPGGAVRGKGQQLDFGVFARWGTLAAVVAMAASSAVAAAAVSAVEIARYQPKQPPPLTADAVYVVDVTSNTELFAVNADAPLPPASLTKVAAALVVLERANLEEIVEITASDLVDPEQSQVGLVAGDRLSMRDLFVGMLVPSGNDATLALARALGEEALGEDAPAKEAVTWFVAEMNGIARTLGADDSHFVNATGIDAEGHLMSARDVATLTEIAMENPVFAETVAMTGAVLSSQIRPEGYVVSTTNQLLQDGLVSGVKTGTTVAAGGCLVSSFAVGPNAVLAVVLGSDVGQDAEGLQDNSARYNDTRAILDAVGTDYVWIDPGENGVLAGFQEELAVWGVGLPDRALQPVPANNTDALRFRLVLGAPAKQDERAGEILFFIGDQLLAARPAVQVG